MKKSTLAGSILLGANAGSFLRAPKPRVVVVDESTDVGTFVQQMERRLARSRAVEKSFDIQRHNAEIDAQRRAKGKK